MLVFFTIFATDSVPKEQANALFTSILHTEVTPPISPTRPIASGSGLLPSTPTRRRLFAYNSPSNPATPTRRLDDPTDEAYSMSPVRAQSRQLLESPRRQLRSVCKTPYRVLDAPELADDFYLNLVDWSSTNVLGVGLGSCVYLWTRPTPPCPNYATSPRPATPSPRSRGYKRGLLSLSERSLVGYTYTTPTHSSCSGRINKRIRSASALLRGTPTYYLPVPGTGRCTTATYGRHLRGRSSGVRDTDRKSAV